jgi:N,N'-diacetyllegionaminate synthase
MNKNQKKVFIIAEAGVNHNGSLEIAKKLIDEASNAGADAIKFQTFITDLGIVKNTKKVEYQIKNTNNEETQYEMIKKLELPFEYHKELFEYCKEKKIMFLSTGFDFPSIDLLDSLGVEIFKIGSGEIINLPLLRKIGKLNKKVIISTGMSDIGEIEDALDILIEAGTLRENIIVLHANTEYPTSFEDVNLRAMVTIGNTFDIEYGYSDHTLGIEIDIAAVAMGACCIEKHFTLDKNMDGPDHKASLEPNELKAMVKAIRNIELALGNGIKKPSKSELRNIDIIRKVIVSKKFIEKGNVIKEDDLIIKRISGNGISPMQWDKVIGTVALKNYKVDEPI